MAARGRPPIPTEIKRRRGTLRPGRLPAPGNVAVLRQADGVPACPGDLGLDGQRLWDRAWDAAITWLSPVSDACQVEEACRLADDLTLARGRYRATLDPGDARTLVACSKALTEALAALGFNPVARSRLGVAEVRRVSALEELINRRVGR